MNRFNLLKLKWKMGFKCLWWLFKYRKEKLVTAKVYIGSHYQAPHLSEVYYILDQPKSPCYMSNFTDKKDRAKTLFSPTIYSVTSNKIYLLDGKNVKLGIAPFSHRSMEAGHSLQKLKQLYKGHNLSFLYTTVVRL